MRTRAERRGCRLHTEATFDERTKPTHRDLVPIEHELRHRRGERGVVLAIEGRRGHEEGALDDRWSRIGTATATIATALVAARSIVDAAATIAMPGEPDAATRREHQHDKHHAHAPGYRDCDPRRRISPSVDESTETIGISGILESWPSRPRP